MIFNGVCTAIVTPFNKNGELDLKSFDKILDMQIKAKVGAVLVLGTTGESSTVDFVEREKLILFAKKKLPKSIKLIVGTGSNCTKTAIKDTKQAKDLGADAVLCVTPYYNKTTQKGILEYYSQIDQLGVPFIAYNVPSRTGVNILPSTYSKLENLQNFAGIKEANGDIMHILKTFFAIKNTPIYCGNDNLSKIFYDFGAKGIISVVSNVFPNEVVLSWKNEKEQKEYFQKFFKFSCDLFLQPNPIAVKYAMQRKRLIKNILRPPLLPLENCYKKIINKDMENLWKL